MPWLPKGFGRGTKLGGAQRHLPSLSREMPLHKDFWQPGTPHTQAATPISNSMQCCTTSAPPAALRCHPRQGESSRCRAPACPCPQLPRAHPGPALGQLKQAGRGAWTCPMPSRVACLQCHELPWAPSKEAGVGVGKSWHPPPCSYSEEAGATSALEGRPPGCTRPWLEENAHSRAATGWCRMVQPTPPMSQLGLSCNHHVQPPELYCRNLAAHTTPAPWCVIEGLRLLLLQKAGALPPPACRPPNQGPSWGTSTVTLVQGKLSYLTVGSTKPGQRDTLQKGGWSYTPQGLPKGSGSRGVRAGCYQSPCGQGGSGLDRGQRLPQRRLRLGFNVHPHP